ncbi:nuclear transport factor 2 family protein [Actinomadura opuntiae]|uniref:nuclear transport factor 2 family protein n=1 Tax=Actinomadura sp. OS1-43 TaxID=604315 RepID=UPI00255AB975|nr:nuclear transport factor 2 family protein [Actinomadura sp. OS1-43]MDL4818513.1 nuclear transport factor 2 family protein [Actinomadura sp. OS1-43]
MPHRDDVPRALLRRSLLAGGVGIGVSGYYALPAAAAAGSPDSGRRPMDLAGQKEVESVVLTERWARDMAQWDVMAEQFHPDSLVDISWIQTSGPEFVRLSRQSFEAGGRSCHVLSPVLIQVNGDRATADTGAIIAGQISVGGVDVCLTAYSRIVERLEKRGSDWRISELKCIYQFDYLTPQDPDATVRIDADRLARYRPSYAALSYWVEETRGAAAVRDDLAGVDRPGTIKKLYAANSAWLARGRRR